MTEPRDVVYTLDKYTLYLKYVYACVIALSLTLSLLQERQFHHDDDDIACHIDPHECQRINHRADR